MREQQRRRPPRSRHGRWRARPAPRPARWSHRSSGPPTTATTPDGPPGSRPRCGPRRRRSPTPAGPRTRQRRGSPASAAVSRARCIGLVSTMANERPRKNGPRAMASRRPSSVSGRSVRPVWRLALDQSVSPWRTTTRRGPTSGSSVIACSGRASTCPAAAARSPGAGPTSPARTGAPRPARRAPAGRCATPPPRCPGGRSAGDCRRWRRRAVARRPPCARRARRRSRRTGRPAGCRSARPGVLACTRERHAVVVPSRKRMRLRSGGGPPALVEQQPRRRLQLHDGLRGDWPTAPCRPGCTTARPPIATSRSAVEAPRTSRWWSRAPRRARRGSRGTGPCTSVGRIDRRLAISTLAFSSDRCRAAGPTGGSMARSVTTCSTWFCMTSRMAPTPS